jgi:hypothetical protein
LGLGVAIIVGAVLASASGAATTRTQTSSKIDVSTRASVIHYLRSIHVSTKHVVIQRGLRNYAGANCPGNGWTCAGTRHTVVQIAKRGGLNRYACTTAKCAVVQIGGAYRSPVKATPKPPPPMNTALCAKTTGVVQSCVINQPNASGTNQALVWMVTPKDTGLTQSSYYSATITQGPASAAGSSNNNIACVNQFVWLDGSTTKTNTSSTTVTNDNHELITINQNSLSGNNTVQGAKTTNQAGTAYDCDGTQPLTQSELLTSIVNSKGSITQNQDTLPSTTSCVPAGDPSFVGCANVVTNIEQNQNLAGGFKGFASGLNNASFTQSINQVAVANTPSGTVTQQQNALVSGPPFSGAVGTINQDSTNTSTAVVEQDETQCQDAVNVWPQTIPAPTAPTGFGSAVCPNNPDAGVPPGVAGRLTQTQYGPLGVGTPSNQSAGPVHFHTKGYGKSQQTNAGSGVTDSFTLTQKSTQNSDPGGRQFNTVQGDCTSSGNNSATGGSCQAGETVNQNNASTTTAGWTAPNIPDVHINCQPNHPCAATAPPAPVIDAGSKGSTVVEVGTAKTFTWTDFATNGVKFQCSTDGTHYNDCNLSDAIAHFANTTPGTYSFYVRAANSTGTLNPSAPDSFTWNVVDANVAVTPTSGVSEVGNSQTFTITTNALPAGTTASLPTITPAFSQSADVESDDCATPTVGTNTASCTVTITNNSPTTITVTATATWHFSDGTNSADVTRMTDGTHNSNSGATAQFVDAYVTVSPLHPSETAGTSDPVTATVYVNDGSGGGYVLTGGVPVTFSKVDGGTASSVFIPGGVNTCTTSSVTGPTLGTCAVTVNSGNTGTTTVHASFSNLNVDGALLSRATGDTNPLDSPDALITWTT